MKAVAVRDGGKTAADLCIIEVARPETGRGHVLIRVTHAGVNRPDILQRRGLYPPPPGASPIMGLEVAGVIEQIVPDPQWGDDIGWKVGDQVCALVNGGGYAAYVSVDIRHLLPVPKGLSLAEAASLPEVSLTVYANLIEHGGLKAGEAVLVHGANSGIGSMTVMLGKAVGARVIATVRGAERIDWVRALGADVVIDTAAGDFIDTVKAEGGADVILDIVAGDYVAKNILCLKPRGRLVQVGMARGNTAEIDVTRIMQKQAILTGSMLRPRSPEEKARLTAEVRAKVWPLIEAGAIRPVVAKVFPFAEVGAAHAFLDSGAHSGKVVLEL
ncbi:NAD(P)H-quinone oxidoreductase [Asticcacaulis sp. BYS171W]|uniref:NAD(P)H-quinone oxidoreductase n=1 Tax=Asticcacaulis aquaticus TaxID=2984212 RepID=A0ABT5HQN4_9CAUL|nr:NAD(P)H-quinone oxidoreductase [Asticcacaulis aquaticus]MDC7682380.1 NAD(P)H-quinone oxidoreductase [Asticcacaulis aquaticus]